MIHGDHPRSRHVTDPPSDLKIVCAWCDKVLEEGSGEVSHVICPECYEQEVKPFVEKQRQSAKRGKKFRPPPPEEIQGPFYWVEGQLILGFAIIMLIFLIVMGAEGLHWLTGGRVPELIEWKPKTSNPNAVHARHDGQPNANDDVPDDADKMTR